MSDPNNSIVSNFNVYSPVYDTASTGDSFFKNYLYFNIKHYWSHIGYSEAASISLKFYCHNITSSFSKTLYCKAFDNIIDAKNLTLDSSNISSLHNVSLASENLTTLTIDSTGWKTIDLTNQIISDRFESLQLYGNLGTIPYTSLKLYSSLSNSETSLVNTLESSYYSLFYYNAYFGNISDTTTYRPYLTYNYQEPVPADDGTNIIASAFAVQYIYDSTNKYKRIFLKFTLPTNISKKTIKYAYLKLASTYTGNANQFLPLRTYTTENINWTGTSSNSTLNYIFSTATNHLFQKESGILESRSNYLFDIYGHVYVDPEIYEDEETQAIIEERNNIKGLAWLQRNNYNTITVILDNYLLTDSATNVISSINLSLGSSADNPNSLKQFYNTNATTSSNKPQILLGYQCPIINITPTSISKTIEYGTNLPSDALSIFNSGTGTLNASIFASYLPWVQSISPNTCQLDYEETSNHTISYNTSSLNIGDYSGNIYVQDLNAITPTVTCSVSLHVVSSAFIEINKTSIEKITNRGYTIDSDTFTITNGYTNTSTLEYSISSDSEWLILSDSSGTLNSLEFDTITLTFDTTNLQSGEYNGIITISNDLDVSDTHLLSVTLNINSVSNSGTYGHNII